MIDGMTLMEAPKSSKELLIFSSPMVQGIEKLPVCSHFVAKSYFAKIVVYFGIYEQHLPMFHNVLQRRGFPLLL